MRRSFQSMLCVVVLTAVAAPRVAKAEPSPEDRAAAESLFRDGRAMMDAGRYADGCRKLEESHRLDPAPGTQLNLAVCHEKEGKIATAWAEFQSALAQAKKDGRADREQLARERIAVVEPDLPKLVIDVPEAARVPGLRVLRNGTGLQSGAWGAALPVDPGTLTVEASAPGRKPWKTTLVVTPKKAFQVAVPVLEVAPEEPKPIPSASAGPPPPREPVVNSTKRTAGIALGAAGLALMGVGGYFGFTAISKRKDSDAECPVVSGVERCTTQGASLNDSAKSAARASNVAMGVGVLAAGAGAYLFFTSTSKVELAVTPSSGTASWKGSF